MILQGKYGTATVFTDMVESTAISQIIELLNQPFAEGANIKIMTDVHAGKGCVIGTTMRIQDKVCPNLVGVDIGCGMLTVITNMFEGDISLPDFDRLVHEKIPSGFSVRNVGYNLAWQADLLGGMKCWPHINNKNRIMLSLGTLGGGNHFIELNKDKAGRLCLVIHTGSRNLGLQVATYYQDWAIHNLKERRDIDVVSAIEDLKAQGRQSEIQLLLKSIKCKIPPVPEHLAYLEGGDKDDYIHDMQIAQRWAQENREAIAYTLLDAHNLTNRFHTVHNYIDYKGILRKGAVSAAKGEMLTIPLNMRDGSLICIGKSNDDWNQSAPHGAGRLMSRGQAKRSLSLDEFNETMSGVYSTTVNAGTLDEAPMAYKPMQEIIDAIGDTVEIVDRIVPIYNFKASGD